jgi:hypothetical protein
MIEHTFVYKPVGLPAHLPHRDDRAVFAALYPEHHAWLCERNIPFQVSGYYWPLLLGMILCSGIGEEVCQMQLTMPAEHAEAFAQSTGLDAALVSGKLDADNGMIDNA